MTDFNSPRPRRSDAQQRSARPGMTTSHTAVAKGCALLLVLWAAGIGTLVGSIAFIRWVL